MTTAVSEVGLMIAKAGGSAEWPENSLTAIRATVELARAATRHRIAVEVDVRCSADGHLLLHHDATLGRVTGGTGPINARSLGELRGLRTESGESLITLDEAWENIPELETIVELHDGAPQTLLALRAWLNKLGSSERARVVIASERTRAISAVREMRMGVRTSATLPEGLRLLAFSHLGHLRGIPRGHVWMLPRRFFGLNLMRPRLIQAAGHRGDPVWAWVIETADTARQLFEMGVTGIFTTRPAEMLAQLEPSFGG